MIYRRGVRCGACSCLLFLFIIFIFRQLTPRDAPLCVCLPLSLLDLIAAPLSLLLDFIPLCGAFVVLVLVLVLSSYLGCLALLIYVYGCLSCPTRIICGCPGLFCFCFLVFPPESLPGDVVLCRLLPRPLASVCFLPCLFVLFCFSILRPFSSPICFGVNSSIL